MRPSFTPPLYPDTRAVCERLDYIIKLLEARPEVPVPLFDALRDYAERMLPATPPPVPPPSAEELDDWRRDFSKLLPPGQAS